MAEVAMNDSKYQRMLFHTENATPDKYIEKDCDLHHKNSSERRNLSIFTCSNGYKLLIRNSEEIVVPECARAEVLKELHSTHLCSDGMKRLARGKMHWRNMGKDIEKIYNKCQSCREHSRSKPNIPGRRNEVIPTSL